MRTSSRYGHLARLWMPLAIMVWVASFSPRVHAQTWSQPYQGQPTNGVPESGGQQAGGALGLASVEQATGTAHATIDFQLPKARGRFQPTLGLSYSSASGQREAGVGWGIDLPMIERHNPGGPPRYNDPSPDLTNKGDFFRYNGLDLVPICTVGSSGAPCDHLRAGEEMPTWAKGWHYFRLEADTTFSRFFWSPDRLTWVIQDKTGVTTELGAPRDNVTDLTGVDLDPVTTSANSVSQSVFRWNVVRQYDAMGPNVNPIYYQWQKLDNVIGYLTDIFYTNAKVAASDRNTFGSTITPASTFAHHVHLWWEIYDTFNVPGWVPSPLATRRVNVWRRFANLFVARVDITSATMLAQSRVLTRSYAMSYQQPGGGGIFYQRYLLGGVQMTGTCQDSSGEPLYSEDPSTGTLPVVSGDPLAPAPLSNCPAASTLPATTMTYSTPTALSMDVTAVKVEVDTLGLGTSLFDQNGDGLPDLMRGLNLGNGTPTASFNLNSPGGVLNSMGASQAIALQSQTPPGLPPNDPLPSLASNPAAGWILAPGHWGGYGVTQTGSSTFIMSAAYDSIVAQYAVTGPPYQWSYTGSIQAEAGATPFCGVGNNVAEGDQTWSLCAFVDLDGDGYSDVLQQDRATGEITSWLTTVTEKNALNDPTGQTIPAYMGAPTAFATPSTFCWGNDEPQYCNQSPGPVNLGLADMNGDGAADLITLVPTTPDPTGMHGGPYTVVVARGNGDGTFDDVSWTPSNFNGAPYPTYGYTFADFTVQDLAPIFHDLNGDGIADMIWSDAATFGDYGQGGVTQEVCVMMSSGHGLLPGTDLSSAVCNNIPEYSQILFGDMNGSGVDDIVILSPAAGQSLQLPLSPSTLYTVSYWDLLDGQAPALLTSISNNVGAETSLTYESTTQAMQAALQSATPWDSWALSPQVIHMVKTLTTTVQGTMEGGPTTLSYDYRDPVYDNSYNYFVGFNRVTETLEASESGRKVVTTTSFDLADDCDKKNASGCSAYPLSWNRPIRVLRGLPIRTDVADSDGNLLSSIHHEYKVSPLYHGIDQRITRYAYDEQTDTWLADTSATDATGSTSVTTTDVQDTDPSPFPDEPGDLGTLSTGPSTYTLKLAPHSAWVHIQTNSTIDDFGNLQSTVEHGIVGGGPGTTHDSPITYATAWTPANGGWLWRPKSQTTSGAGGNYSRTLSFVNDVNGNLVKVSSDLSASIALNRASQTDPTPSDQAPNGTVVLTQSFFNGYGNLTGLASNGNTRCSVIAYDPLFNELPVKTTAYPGGCSVNAGGTELQPVTSPSPLLSTWSYDRGLQVRTMMIGPDHAEAQESYNPFGRLSQAFPPALSGMGSDTTASFTGEYATPNAGDYYRLEEFRERDDNGTTASYRRKWKVLDGLGRLAAMFTQADPTDPQPWIVSGLVQRDARGLVVRAYEPFFTSSVPSRSGLPDPSGTKYRSYKYDAFGRLAQSTQLDGTTDRKVTYGAVFTTSLDATLINPTKVVRDGFGRVVVTEVATTTTPSDKPIVTHQTYLPTGEVTELERCLGGTSTGTCNGVADTYKRSLKYDSLGRLVSNEEPNSGTWEYAYDIAGYLVGTADARGCGENITRDGVGRVTSEDYLPCGGPSAIGYTMPMPNGDGTEVFYKYDAPETGQTGTAAELYAGRLAATYDRSEHVRYGYDARGRQVSVTKQIAAPTKGALADLGLRYAPSWYRQDFAYDELNRVVAQSTGSSASALQGSTVDSTNLPSLTSFASLTSVVTTTFDTRGFPTSVGGSYSSIVNTEVHDADDLLMNRVYGDVAATKVSAGYATNRWLSSYSAIPSHSVPSGTPSVFQSTTWSSFDAVGNPKEVTDLRSQGETASFHWPAGSLPVSRKVNYDDLYRVGNVTSTYGLPTAPAASDTQTTSVFPAEPPSLPYEQPGPRPSALAYQYDWQGNLTTSGTGAAKYGETTAAPGPNQLSGGDSLGTSSNSTYTTAYDAAGNLTSLAWSAGSEFNGTASTVTYEWDEVGRLAQAHRVDTKTSLVFRGGRTEVETTTTADFEDDFGYDGGGSRVWRSSTASGAPKYWLEIFPSFRLDGADFGSDYADDESTETLYLIGSGHSYGRVVYDPNMPPTAVAGTRGRSFLHVLLDIADAQGSTSSVVDRASSTLVEQRTYLPYGRVDSEYRAPNWDSFRETYGYTGKEDDYAMGIVYFGARYYSPATGRWISPDPLSIHALRGDLNPYSFVHGSPMLFVDRLGLDGAESSGPATSGGGVSNVTGPSSDGGISTLYLEVKIDSTFHFNKEGFVSPQTLFYQGTGAVYTNGVGEEFWNPYASTPLESALLGAYTGNPREQREAFEYGIRMTPVIGPLIIIADPQSSRLQKIIAIGTFALPYAGRGVGMIAESVLAVEVADVVDVVDASAGGAVDAAEGVGGAAEETITLYHGSVDNFSGIRSGGLSAARTPTWVTTDLEAAQNAIGPGRVLSPGQGVDTGVVTSTVPLSRFQSIQQAGGISGLRLWPGFGGEQTFGEYVLRSPEAIELFNVGIGR